MRVSRTIFGHRSSWLGRWPRLHRRIRQRYLVRHAMAVPMTDGLVLCRILGPFKFYADPDDRGISPHIILDGYWEPRTTELMVDRLRPGMVAIDVGANIGYFTVLMALLAGPRGRVLAFEPNPDSARRLEGSLLINGLTERVVVHREPVSDKAGQAVRLIADRNFAGGGHITPASAEEGTETLSRTRRLDEVPGALDAAMVKIDTEGMEEAVWRGMRAMIAGAALRWVVVEFTRDSYVDAGAMLDEALAAGFTLNRIDDNRGVVPTTRDAILAGSRFQMLLFER